MHPYNPEWLDMSNYLVHFTKPGIRMTEYDNMLSILGSQSLYARNPFGIIRDHAPAPQTQLAVCFSEIPLHLLDRLSERRGSYGIGFTKQFILFKGGGPIWNVENGSPAEVAIREVIHQTLDSTAPDTNPVWAMTPFIDSTGDHPGGTYRFEWEREWRLVGNLNFTEQDVSFLIIPEKLHGAAREFFENALQENIGPAYFCPYIDVGWDIERIRTTLEQHQP
jgi:hypothetical protein